MISPDDIFTDEPQLSDSDQKLIELYAEVGKSVDSLAYTDEFDQIYTQYQRAGFPGTQADVFRRLLILRKSGVMPRLFHDTESR